MNKIINLMKERLIPENVSDAFVVIDVSKSMYKTFKDGQVQKIVEDLFKFAEYIDRDRQIEVVIFGNEPVYIGTMNKSNIDGFIKREIFDKHNINQATNYGSMIDFIVTKNLRNKSPSFAFVITDGDATDKEQAKLWLMQSARSNVFFQFWGIGKENFSFLDNCHQYMTAPVLNIDIQKHANFDNFDTYVIEKSIGKGYSNWLKYAKEKSRITW